MRRKLHTHKKFSDFEVVFHLGLVAPNLDVSQVDTVAIEREANIKK